MKTGLVLEGGAMRGLFSCGVLDVFLEEGIRFDAAAGISAGAVFGCNFKSGARSAITSVTAAIRVTAACGRC